MGDLSRKSLTSSACHDRWGTSSGNSRERIGEVVLFPGIVEILDLLRDAEIPLGVITGKDRERTIEILGHLGVESRFGIVVTPSDPPNPKPSPDGVYWACWQLGARPEQSVVVGDSVADLEAGQTAGSTTIACLWEREPNKPCSRLDRRLSLELRSNFVNYSAACSIAR